MADRRHREFALHFLLLLATLFVQPRDFLEELGELLLQLSDDLLFVLSFLG